MVDDRSEQEFHAQRLAQFLELAAAGYHLAPVTIWRLPNGKKGPDYHGIRWHDAATADPAVILDWWAQYGPTVSMALDTGHSDAVGVDLDIVALPDGTTIDAVAAWAEESMPVGSVLVNTPSGGQHHIFGAPYHVAGPLNAKRVLGLPIDVRAVGGHLYAPGSVVLNPDGTPEPGGLYTLQGPLVAVEDLEELPQKLIDLFTEPARTPRSKGPSAQGEPKDRAWVIGQCQDQLERIRTWPPVEGTGFRYALLGAAMVLGRAVTAGLVKRAHAETRLGDAVHAVWGSVDAQDRTWIQDGLDDGEDDPWTIVRPAPEPAVASTLGATTAQLRAPEELPTRSTPENLVTDGDEDPLAPEVGELRIARLVAQEVERIEVRALADREVARRRRGARPSIASGVLDDLDAIEPPAMLLGSLIPQDAVGILSGRSGSYKSFVAGAWAACIATGRAWLDRPEFAVSEPRKGLYVAAEGPRGAAGRVRAWEAATGVSGAGKLLLYPRAIRLNDPDETEELAEYVAANGIGFVTIDTLRVSTPGAEENSSTDWGMAFGALTRLRDDHGCSSLIVDHSGHAEDWRPRGTSAKITDPDYLISVTYEGAGAGPEAQRQLTVRKLKDDEVTGDWPIRLQPVPGQKFPVAVIGRVGELGRFVPAGRWWEPDVVPMPEAIRDAIGTGRGSAAARDIWRVLRFVHQDGSEGLSRADVRAALKECPDRAHAPSTVEAGFTLLAKPGVALIQKPPVGGGRWTLTLRGLAGT